MKFNLLITTLLFVTFSFSQSKGTLSGVITDKEAGNTALPFANVIVKGTSIAVTTNETGNYSISLNPGNYIVQFSFIGYENVEKSVTVKVGETSTLNCSLGSGNYTLKDVVVKSAGKNREKESALLLEQMKAVEMKQSIGAQEMDRKGISNVEEGLTKVTGITKVESRGLFVRGLENRYNNLLINDLQVPSNSPFKKIIPLDLFPTDIVGVLSVYKTFNANMPGDFAGATINVETSEPQTSQTKLSVGFGYVTNNNTTDFLLSETATNDQGFFGIQKKYRKLPKEYGNIGNVRLNSTEYLNSYKNNSWNVDKVGAPINNSISFSHSNKFKFENSRSFTYLVSLNWDNRYQLREGVERTFIEGGNEYNNNLKTTSNNYITSTSALVGLKYKSNRFQLATNSMFIRTTENLIEDQLGFLQNQKDTPNRFIRLNQFEQTDYFNNQLTTSYKLTSDNKQSIRGGIGYVKTLYELPDRKFLVGLKNNDGTFSNTYGGSTLNRQHFTLKGNYFMSGLIEYNYNFGKEIDGKTNKLSVGFNSFRNNLSATYRLFSTIPINTGLQTNTDINTINGEIIDDITNGLIFEREESDVSYKQKFDQFVNAGYVNILINATKKLEINGGIRLESSSRIIKYRELGNNKTIEFNDPYLKNESKKNYFLPTINSKYKLNEKSNIRFAASQTITRPVLMELLPIKFVNADGDVELGNLNLVDTQNLNADLKYEFLSDKKDIFVVGVYAKNIKDPIERVFIPSASLLTTYKNSKSANLYGAEFETIFQLSNLSYALKDLSVGFNASLMKTKVEISKENELENNSSRELQGASNWVLNADAKYDFTLGKDIKNTVSLVYGVKSKSIFSVGSAGVDHIYELPFQKLDFVYSSKLTKNINVKFSADNILNPVQKFELGSNNQTPIIEQSLIVRDFRRGVGFSLNVSYVF